MIYDERRSQQCKEKMPYEVSLCTRVNQQNGLLIPVMWIGGISFWDKIDARTAFTSRTWETGDFAGFRGHDVYVSPCTLRVAQKKHHTSVQPPFSTSLAGV